MKYKPLSEACSIVLLQRAEKEKKDHHAWLYPYAEGSGHYFCSLSFGILSNVEA